MKLYIKSQLKRYKKSSVDASRWPALFFFDAPHPVHIVHPFPPRRRQPPFFIIFHHPRPHQPTPNMVRKADDFNDVILLGIPGHMPWGELDPFLERDQTDEERCIPLASDPETQLGGLVISRADAEIIEAAKSLSRRYATMNLWIVQNFSGMALDKELDAKVVKQILSDVPPWSDSASSDSASGASAGASNVPSK